MDVPKPIDYIPVHKRKLKKRIPRKAPGYKLRKVLEGNQYHIGDLLIGTTNNIPSGAWSHCTVSTPNHEENIAVFDFDSLLVIVELLTPKSMLTTLLTTKAFSLDVFIVNQEVFLKIYLTTLPLPNFTKNIGAAIQLVFEQFFNITFNEPTDLKSNESINEIYENVRLAQKRTALGDVDVQHSDLKPKLRPYQADAVRWMLSRENAQAKPSNDLHPLYTDVKLKSGLVVYYDKFSGFVTETRPEIEPGSSLGGILADEMGLGKTVEVLSCILTHTASNTMISNTESTQPIITEMSRKRKRTPVVEEPPGHEAKKLNVSEAFVKKNNKSQLRECLEQWYNSRLNDLPKPSSGKRPREVQIGVQCVCGKGDKTDVFACVDCQKKQHGACLGYARHLGPYRCPQCWVNQPLIESGTTLIVVPVALRKQWCNEIRKHVRGPFKVLVYGGFNTTPIYPSELARYDVVITTYSVLKFDFRLTATERSLTFRRQRKYSPPKSPITRLNWWRLCLDEAQTVESTSTIVAEMAKKLTARHRWAVTGTPISKDISELHGLINYLEMEPFNDLLTWRHVLMEPYLQGNVGPMYEFLGQVLWRTSKDIVLDQIGIPKQTVREYWLEFTAIEHYFYRGEHQSNSDLFQRISKDLDPNLQLENLDRSLFKRTLAPLSSVRQVCDFPNSVKARYLLTKKPLTSMSDLLEALIGKNTLESEEFLRVVLFSLNGLAGAYLLLDMAELAVERYREVLQLYARFTTQVFFKLSVDKLQVIHAMYNLGEIIEAQPTLPKTLRDDKLLSDRAELEQSYISKFVTQSVSALQSTLIITASIDKMQKSFELEPRQWFSDLLELIYVNNYTGEFYSRVENMHHVANAAVCTVENNRGLLYVLSSWDDALTEKRDEAFSAVSALYTETSEMPHQVVVSEELVEQATRCHLATSKKAKSKEKCGICLADEALKFYELELFAMKKRTVTFEEQSLQGSWKARSEELVLKAIIAVGKMKGAQAAIIADGETHLSLLEALKKEFRELRKFWTQIYQQANAMDELNMCKFRLRLRDENEKPEPPTNSMLKNLSTNTENKTAFIHVLSKSQLGFEKSNLSLTVQENMFRLEKNLGIRKYLETLKEQDFDNKNLDPCPVCKSPLQKQWSILPCGHTYCLECMPRVIGPFHNDRAKCCICRYNFLIGEISYVKTDQVKKPETGASIKGNYSTKVEGVVKLILELKTQDDDVKILVFSTWRSVLTYLTKALTDNNITSLAAANAGHLERQVEKFKDQSERVTALLLPVHFGAKGLNLTEATHVILIEPLLDLGDELQAIGRVHRIGQLRPTVVHKFFIKNTIEETIHKAVGADAHNWDKSKVTIKQLVSLFGASAPSGAEE